MGSEENQKKNCTLEPENKVTFSVHKNKAPYKKIKHFIVNAEHFDKASIAHDRRSKTKLDEKIIFAAMFTPKNQKPFKLVKLLLRPYNSESEILTYTFEQNRKTMITTLFVNCFIPDEDKILVVSELSIILLDWEFKKLRHVEAKDAEYAKCEPTFSMRNNLKYLVAFYISP